MQVLHNYGTAVYGIGENFFLRKLTKSVCACCTSTAPEKRSGPKTSQVLRGFSSQPADHNRTLANVAVLYLKSFGPGSALRQAFLGLEKMRWGLCRDSLELSLSCR